MDFDSILENMFSAPPTLDPDERRRANDFITVATSTAAPLGVLARLASDLGFDLQFKITRKSKASSTEGEG